MGRSLGVNLVRAKWCTFDCLYCQLGRTSERSLDRVVFMQLDELIVELREALTRHTVDFVTLAGSGEPALHAQLAQIIAAIRRLTTTPIAVLTNGAFLHDGDVRAACGLAHVVLPTLAAHNEEQYQRIHRPCGSIHLKSHIDGLLAFREDQPAASMWLELFLLEGLNAAEADFGPFETLIQRINPERIQINTATQPAFDEAVCAVSPAKMRSWARRLGPRVEVVADLRD